MKAKLAIFALTACMAAGHALADGLDPVGRKLDWHTEQVDDVVAFPKFGGKTMVEGKECVTGSHLNFKINEELAFDIDEPVEVTIETRLQPTPSRLTLMYDGNGLFPGAEPPKIIDLPASAEGRLYRQTITLERARFANLGFQSADLSIMSDRPFTLCELSIKRSYKTPIQTQFGRIAIEVTDEKGRKTPVRVGLYDKTGRLPLPGDEAVPLRNGAQGITRITELGGFSRDVPVWPVANRSVFYIDGSYQARLAPGTYTLVIAKGPEYRLSQRTITVSADATATVQVRLDRWADLPGKGWYSGDAHFHYPRDSAYDDRNLQLFLQGEDVHVANDFQMGNIAKAYVPQYSWDPIRYGPDNAYAIVIGQEDPRTSLLGHVAHMNIRKPFRNPPHYLLYDEGMRRTRDAGGLVGYAHAVDPARDCPADITHSDVARGLAIDVPAGLVDYMEVLSINCSGDSLWFDFLNLGYRLTPAAGTDYPVGPVLGSLRSYVRIDGEFDPPKWFDGLKKGRTFATNGPMLEFTANGQDMGSELRLRAGQPIRIQAKASLNPDMGPIIALELVEQGVVTKTATPGASVAEATLDYVTPARHGTWFVVRARGAKPGVMAWSAPVYVSVDGQRSWKREAVPAIAAAFKKRILEAIRPAPLEDEAVEPFDAMADMARYWPAQQPALTQRVRQASARYDALIEQADRLAETRVRTH